MAKRLAVAGQRVLLIALASTGAVACGIALKRPAQATAEESTRTAETSQASTGRSTTLPLPDENSAAGPQLKEHWARIAQLRFDEGRYASAMVAAEQVLERAPGDVEAEALMTLAGMRIANASVARLQSGNGAVSERARTEMTLLADALRGPAAVRVEDAPTPLHSVPASRGAAVRRVPTSAAPAQPTGRTTPRAGASDPFRNIGN